MNFEVKELPTQYIATIAIPHILFPDIPKHMGITPAALTAFIKDSNHAAITSSRCWHTFSGNVQGGYLDLAIAYFLSTEEHDFFKAAVDAPPADKVDQRVQLITMAGGKCAVHEMKGSYLKLGTAWPEFMQSIRTSGMKLDCSRPHLSCWEFYTLGYGHPETQNNEENFVTHLHAFLE